MKKSVKELIEWLDKIKKLKIIYKLKIIKKINI